MRARSPEPALFVAAAIAPCLDARWGAPLLALSALLWLALLRPPRRELWVAGSALLVALSLLVADLPALRPAGPDWESRAEERYDELWRGLERSLATVESRLGAAALESRQQAFDVLIAAVGTGRAQRIQLLLLDPDGAPWAWAGEGLRHEVGVDRLPRAGRTHRASFSAATLLAVRPLGDEARPWRLVAGRTYETDRLPFAPPGGPSRERFRWTLTDRPPASVAGGRLIEATGAPAMVVEGPLPVPPLLALARPLHRLALAAIGLALLGLAVLRGVGLALRTEELAPRPPPRRLEIAALVWLGSGLWALAATASPAASAALLSGLALALLSLVRRLPSAAHAFSGEPAAPSASWSARLVVAPLAAAGGLLSICAFLQRVDPVPLDLAGEIAASPAIVCYRLALAAAAYGLLLLAGPRRLVGERGAWLAALALVAAAALHDLPWAGVPLLLAAFVAASLWSSAHLSPRRPGVLAATVLLAAMCSATAWETVHRLELRGYLASTLLPRMGPPTAPELRAVETEIERFFAAQDVFELTPYRDSGLEHQDLAYALWRRSPLATANAVSALIVEPATEPASSFAFGLELYPELDRAELPLGLPGLPQWNALEIAGSAPLLAGGEPWGRVRYWLKPRPGFGLDTRAAPREIASALLRPGAPPADEIAGLPEPARYGLYAASGSRRALLKPWEEAPPLAAELAAERPAGPIERVVATPRGVARAWARLGSDGWEVLYLERLRPIAALDRVGTHAVGVLALAALAALLLLLLALPRPAFRDLLQRAVRSYSKRLLIVYSIFVLVPLPLLNLALVTGVERRLWLQQREAGEAVLVSAQRYLGEYLRDLDPGFTIERSTFDGPLRWLSGVVRHDFNLYWGPGESEIASSRPELLTAGLLPQRIPGDVFARLALGGYNLTSRIERQGALPHVELYAPLRIPGVPVGDENFFLSMPLAAQQQRAAEQLADLRRQTLLFTTALLVLLLAVSARLARGFTAPITELVRGTRRIAAGATSLEMAPADLELMALVEAVDDMARRIAEGRQRLVQEKQVVERIVEHITSGVVSLDRDNSVLMRNRVAAELLGVRVGEPIAEALARSPRLAPVAELLEAPLVTPPQPVTLRLAGDDDAEREWSLVRVPVPGSGEPSSLLVVEDATEVLRGQRLEAWAEMARIIAHEIKNPLTPIRLSAEHMQRVHASDPRHFDAVFERCNRNILRQVDELQQIASEFSTYSSLLNIDPQPGDLAATLERLIESYRAAPPPGVEIRFERPDAPLAARFDARLLGRAVRNLVENAIRACAGAGTVDVRLARSGDAARIVVADTGPGVDPRLLGRIFDPYFSTHDTGTGLGLPIARRVAEEHGGSIGARNRDGGGLEVVIALPLG